MKRRLNTTAGVAVALALWIALMPTAFAQQARTPQEFEEMRQQAQHQEKLQQILNDKAAYVAGIARRWENAARESDKWDANYETDLINALMKLDPETLLAAGEAPSFAEMRKVLMTGRRPQSLAETLSTGKLPSARLSEDISPNVLGEADKDLVYTPLTPCRLVDTRNAGGIVVAGTTRLFDADNTVSFAIQGGNPGPCGVPFNVASAIAAVLTVTGPTGFGYLNAWALGAQPFGSVINYTPGDTLANTTIVPIVPGAGNDFSIYAAATTHVVVDVVGYFAAPVATALDCITVLSAVEVIPVNVWTAVDAVCPAGRTATGGGYDVPEGTLGRPGVWVDTQPAGNGWRTWVDNQAGGLRSVQSRVRCCRVPGRL